jgi:adenylate cyclase
MMWTMVAQYFAGEDEASFQSAERLIRFRPDKFVAYRYRAAALGQLGRIEQAKQALQESIGLLPGEYSYFVQSRPPWIPPLQHERLVEGLRKAGLTV